MKKILMLLLALSLCLGALASCGGKSKKPKTTQGSEYNSSSSETDTVESEAKTQAETEASIQAPTQEQDAGADNEFPFDSLT